MSTILAQYLLKGYKMLAESCPDSNVPLMGTPATVFPERTICVACEPDCARYPRTVRPAPARRDPSVERTADPSPRAASPQRVAETAAADARAHSPSGGGAFPASYVAAKAAFGSEMAREADSGRDAAPASSSEWQAFGAARTPASPVRLPRMVAENAPQAAAALGGAIFARRVEAAEAARADHPISRIIEALDESLTRMAPALSDPSHQEWTKAIAAAEKVLALRAVATAQLGPV